MNERQSKSNINPDQRESRPRKRKGGRQSWGLRLTPGGVIVVFLLNLLCLGSVLYPIVEKEYHLSLPELPWLAQLVRRDESDLTKNPDQTSEGREKTTETKTSQTAEVPLDGVTETSLFHLPATGVSSQTASHAQQTPSPESSPVTPPTETGSPEPVHDFTPTTQSDIPWEYRLTAGSGIIVLSLEENGYDHLFLYHPERLPFTRLTNGEWDDMYPALNPDGTKVAFASNQNGWWDLYILDLRNGEISQLTDTPEYDQNPTWSPDGIWLAYETYKADNFDIYILSVNGETSPQQLTHSASADYSPSWSPAGRQIAFISNRGGTEDVWLADLDSASEDNFTNISHDSMRIEQNPSWSPDGRFVTWGSKQEGLHSIYAFDLESPEPTIKLIGNGEFPVWSADNDTILVRYQTPNQSYLSSYSYANTGLALPLIQLPGQISSFTTGTVVDDIQLHSEFTAVRKLTPTPAWIVQITPDPLNRNLIVDLSDVQAPFPKLHDGVDEAFLALRQRISMEAGWDLLSTLENAFVPLTYPLSLGLETDWLFTGRAIAVTTMPLNAGWMIVVREDFLESTYWRIYLRARFQDGSQGKPIHDRPWDFSARFNGEPRAYETGGTEMQSVPSGYWIDLTDLASRYGWERLPSLSTWRYAYHTILFNQFVFRSGLDWRTAMLQLYPQEILITPTLYNPPTATPTKTPRWYKAPTQIPTATKPPTVTPTVR